MASYMPFSFDYYANFFKAMTYNILPPKYKNSEVNFSPLSLTVYLNTICNYRCDFCFLITLDHIGTKKKNIDMEQFLAIIDHPKNIYSSRITLGGGEPFLNKNFFNFVKELRKRKKIISVYTNGSLIEKYFDNFEANPTDYLNISHYDDKFSSITEGLKKIQIMKNRPIVRLSKIISTENITDIEKMLNTADEFNIDSVIFQNYFTTDPKEVYKVIYDDNEDFFNEKKRLAKKYRNIEIIWPNILQKQAKFNCQNISLNATYDADGDLAPCCFIVPPEGKFGNLFSEKNPWNSSGMKDFRLAYKSKTIENDSCKYCYFRQGLSGRYR